jgi:hypothetical protein
VALLYIPGLVMVLSSGKDNMYKLMLLIVLTIIVLP